MTFDDDVTDDTEARAFALEHGIDFEPVDTKKGLEREVVEGEVALDCEKIVKAAQRGEWSTVATLCGEVQRRSRELVETE